MIQEWWKKSGVQRMTATPMGRNPNSTPSITRKVVRIEPGIFPAKNHREFIRLFKSRLASSASESIAQVIETSRYGILVPQLPRNPLIPEDYSEQPAIIPPDKIVKRRRETLGKKLVDRRVVNEDDYRPITNLENRVFPSTGAAKKTSERQSHHLVRSRTPWHSGSKTPFRSPSVFAPPADLERVEFTPRMARSVSRGGRPSIPQFPTQAQTVRPPYEISEFEYLDDDHANRTITPAVVQQDQPQNSRPADALVSAFENLSLGESSYSSQRFATTRTQPILLRRNLRISLERSAEQELLHHDAAQSLSTARRPFYGLNDVLNEERVKNTSALSTPVLLDLGRYEVRLPESHGDQIQSCFRFNPPIRFVSESAVFSAAVPEPYTAHGSRVIITLSHFRDGRNRPTIWKHNGTSMSNKAEVPILAINSEGEFAPAGLKTTSATWILQRRDLGPNSLSLKSSPTASYEIRWEFDSKKKVLPMSPVSLRKVHMEVERVIVQYVYNAWNGPWASSHTKHTWTTETTGWRCPLCNVFGRFSKATHLRYHLQCHHRELEVLINLQDTPYRLTISATAPRDTIDRTDEHASGDPSEYGDQYLRGPTTENYPPLTTEQDVQEWLQGNYDDNEESTTELLSEETTSESANLVTEDESWQSLNPEDSTPQPRTPVPNFVSVAIASPQSPTIRTKRTFAGNDEHSFELARRDGIEEQHVQDDPTQRTAYEVHDELLSPFTVLSNLPLDEFGNLANRVITNEAEIFSQDDVLDEDKVIASLWKRWILLNRSAFLVNRVAGFRSFIEDYYLAIHQAAGWRALRTWLMVRLHDSTQLRNDPHDSWAAYGHVSVSSPEGCGVDYEALQQQG
ncbi:hypothetical protein FRC03_008421 [Tulasnella sp. 419]|nr:hypothetical protein FRC03_008421 [Tulasnella sp. 419]